jgi:hypothetical protein
MLVAFRLFFRDTFQSKGSKQSGAYAATSNLPDSPLPKGEITLVYANNM